MADWDITRIRALPGLRLEVRFADGLEGVVSLNEGELTGVLASLRVPGYFEQVRLVDGAPRWPNGEDLAPDRMHADVRREGEPSSESWDAFFDDPRLANPTFLTDRGKTSAIHALVDNAVVKADAAALLPSTSGMEPLRPHQFVVWLRTGATLPYAFRAGKASYYYSTLEELAAELARRKAVRLWGLPRLHGLREPAENLSAEEATRLVRLYRTGQNASDDIVTMLGMADGVDIDFEPPRAEFVSRPVDFGCDKPSGTETWPKRGALDPDRMHAEVRREREPSSDSWDAFFADAPSTFFPDRADEPMAQLSAEEEAFLSGISTSGQFGMQNALEPYAAVASLRESGDRQEVRTARKTSDELPRETPPLSDASPPGVSADDACDDSLCEDIPERVCMSEEMRQTVIDFSRRGPTIDTRILNELSESMSDLIKYGLATQTDLARIEKLREEELQRLGDVIEEGLASGRRRPYGPEDADDPDASAEGKEST